MTAEKLIPGNGLPEEGVRFYQAQIKKTG